MRLRRLAALRRARRELPATVKLALPIVSGMVAQMMMGLTDTIMVGRVGVVPLAASAFVIALAHLPFVFAFGLMSSVSVLAAQAYGAQQRAGVGEVLRHGLLLCTACGFLTAVVLAGFRPWLHLFGQPPDVVAASGNYLVLIGISMWPALVAHGCKQISEALNRPWIPNFIMLACVLLNALLNWILIYGNLGAPALGLDGAGIATVLARIVMALALIAFVIKAPALQSYQPTRWRAPLSWSTIRDLLRLGWPVGFQHLMEVSAFVFAAIMMGWLSADAIAAHQIAISCAATTFMFAFGIAMASSIRVGHAWGAQQPVRARRIGFAGIALAASVMAFFAVVFIAAGQPIARWFIHSPAVVTLTAELLLVAALFQVADGIQVAALSSLRGMSDVRAPAAMAITSYWIIAVPLAYVLAFRGHHGAVGIWVGLATGLGAAAVLLSWRFHLRTRRTEFIRAAVLIE
jgi:MATE family multidrug resistance protein